MKLTEKHLGIPVIPKKNIKEAAAKLSFFEELEEDGNVFFLKDMADGSTDAVIITLISQEELEEIIAQVKEETEEEVFNAICERLPEPSLVYDRWDGAKAVWY